MIETQKKKIRAVSSNIMTKLTHTFWLWQMTHQKIEAGFCEPKFSAEAKAIADEVGNAEALILHMASISGQSTSGELSEEQTKIIKARIKHT